MPDPVPSMSPEAAARPLVALRGVGKRYGRAAPAVQGMELRIAAGEFVSLLGPSGCGKSTVLRMIAGLASVSEGRIDWAGGVRPRLGFVFQEPTLMPWKTALDNVALPLMLAGVPRAERRARAAAMLARVGLEAAGALYPRELSGGMRMRVSIARALVTEPEVLLLDEPFAALDEITRHRLNDDLLRLWEAQRFTAVFVTHSVFESVLLSGRVVVMAAGPGRVHAEVPVEAPKGEAPNGEAPGPRDQAYRTSPGYAALCRTVSAALEGAMAA